MNVLFLDTETTGFGNCRLIEIAYAHLDGDVTSFRCRPPIAIEAQASAVHGMTEEMLKDLPLFEELPQYPDVKKLIESSVVVAHNASFDIGVLEREGIYVESFIDTKRISRLLYSSLKSHRMQDLKDFFFLETKGETHSAGGDVFVLRELFKRMSADIVAGGSKEEDVVNQMLIATKGV